MDRAPSARKGPPRPKNPSVDSRRRQIQGRPPHRPGVANGGPWNMAGDKAPGLFGRPRAHCRTLPRRLRVKRNPGFRLRNTSVCLIIVIEFLTFARGTQIEDEVPIAIRIRIRITIRIYEGTQPGLIVFPSPVSCKRRILTLPYQTVAKLL